MSKYSKLTFIDGSLLTAEMMNQLSDNIEYALETPPNELNVNGKTPDNTKTIKLTAADIGALSDTDTTLTQVNQAADAKATGEKISQLKSDIEEITTKDYINLLESSDVTAIKTVGNFPHHEYEPKIIKTVNMSDVNETVCELNIKLNAKANRKYLLSALVTIKSGTGKVFVNFYGVDSFNNIFQIYGDAVKYNNMLVGNSVASRTTTIISGVGVTKEGVVTARLRFESADKSLIGEYSEMCLIDITDFSEDTEKLTKYINMRYAERFDLKPKGISLEAKKELEKNLSESKTYTDEKILSLKQNSNYLYGKNGGQ